MLVLLGSLVDSVLDLTVFFRHNTDSPMILQSRISSDDRLRCFFAIFKPHFEDAVVCVTTSDGQARVFNVILEESVHFEDGLS